GGRAPKEGRGPVGLPLRHRGDSGAQKQNRIGIALPPQTPINPLRMPNRAKETQRRNRIETGPPRRIQISNSSKRCRIVKNFAPDCCNNSTPFSPLATPLVVWL